MDSFNYHFAKYLGDSLESCINIKQSVLVYFAIIKNLNEFNKMGYLVSFHIVY